MFLKKKIGLWFSKLMPTLFSLSFIVVAKSNELIYIANIRVPTEKRMVFNNENVRSF